MVKGVVGDLRPGIRRNIYSRGIREDWRKVQDRWLQQVIAPQRQPWQAEVAYSSGETPNALGPPVGPDPVLPSWWYMAPAAYLHKEQWKSELKQELATVGRPDATMSISGRPHGAQCWMSPLHWHPGSKTVDLASLPPSTQAAFMTFSEAPGAMRSAGHGGAPWPGSGGSRAPRMPPLQQPRKYRFGPRSRSALSDGIPRSALPFAALSGTQSLEGGGAAGCES